VGSTSKRRLRHRLDEERDVVGRLDDVRLTFTGSGSWPTRVNQRTNVALQHPIDGEGSHRSLTAAMAVRFLEGQSASLLCGRLQTLKVAIAGLVQSML
jgi:hypothetical protein